MSYKVIEKNEYGVRVRNYSEYSDCGLCKYHEEIAKCKRVECAPNSYYLPDSEVEKLESETDSQKELIDLQTENKQLKDRIKELESMVVIGFVCIGDEDNCPSYMEGKKGCDGCEFWK